MTDDIENAELEESSEETELPPEDIPEPEPPMEEPETEELVPEESAPEEDPGADEAPFSEAESEEPAPVEVISVEELLERLTASAEPEEGEAGEEASEPDEEADGENLPEEAEPEELPPPILEVTGQDGGPVVVQGMEDAALSLEALQDTAIHPALTTPFEEYTVTEALLLLILLALFVSACARLLRGGFTWLRS